MADKQFEPVVGFPEQQRSACVAFGMSVLEVVHRAGLGARMALMSKQEYGEAQRIADSLEYVELVANPQLQREFIDSLYITHNRLERSRE
jgi:uncharacterized 2Fe-2S/4Fe-4S cluster protein (DUF4445 family)